MEDADGVPYNPAAYRCLGSELRGGVLRTVRCTEAVAWIQQQRELPRRCHVVTSLPDIGELQPRQHWRAAANRRHIDFYFLGPPLLSLSRCQNCLHLPLDADALLGRVATHLGLPRGSVVLDERGRKLCDMKPMWPALFPELTARHDFIGYSDFDILLGDLASEVG